WEVAFFLKSDLLCVLGAALKPSSASFIISSSKKTRIKGAASAIFPFYPRPLTLFLLNNALR
ncbi:MAG: hypothetical protein ABIR96_13250, partial [Bdellovibrionota bacterium]